MFIPYHPSRLERISLLLRLLQPASAAQHFAAGVPTQQTPTTTATHQLPNLFVYAKP